MNKIKFLKKLFLAHSTDLVEVMSNVNESLIPKIKNRVLCPICLDPYSEEAIHNNILTEGHIWPKPIRDVSKYEAINTQSVLLCKHCNNKAGGRGDAQMGVLENIKQGEKSGNLFGRRSIEMIFEQNTQPIRLNGVVRKVNETEFNIIFKSLEENNWWLWNNPMEQARFTSAVSDNKPATVFIRPPHQLKPRLAEVGWITSAYLFAFRAFGYRYILHESLNPIRQCILDSFDRSKNPQLPKINMLDVYTCNTCYEHTPRLTVVVPYKERTYVYLFVSLLDYHVTLPFRCVPERFNELLQYKIKSQEIQSSELSSLGELLCIDVTCSKMDMHMCVWDFIFGRPISDIANV